ncbi:oligopeptidase family protein [Cordyceps fumosorosea ARSEF 2679]|uniref:Dipeptidyl-peptidase V n=1 Tax=Cordyceps fumosorosea (strain ARSEF 2679) TaxID=1081104 RepID=A0A167T1X4_CORFA|nr:oligopeptidase family protein [Cordyceps fumosorosea ARSEF 2679]OAA60163.1 oligopeptidase family protein [Cordyceps fumosorosea ARSEF 2679]
MANQRDFETRLNSYWADHAANPFLPILDDKVDNNDVDYNQVDNQVNYHQVDNQVNYNQVNYNQVGNESGHQEAGFNEIDYNEAATPGPILVPVTAESLIEHPKTSSVVPSDCGKWGLFTVSTHQIGTGTTKEICVICFRTQMSFLITDDPAAHDACWIPGSLDVLYLRSKDVGRTEVWIGYAGITDHEKVAEYATELSSLQLKQLQDGTIVFMAAGLADPDGSLYCKDHARCLVIRHVCLYCAPGVRRSLFYNVLRRVVVVEDDTDCEDNTENKDDKDGEGYRLYERYKISHVLHDLIPSSNLEAPSGLCQTGFTSLVDNFAIGPRGVALIARDLGPPGSRPHDISHPYFVPIYSYEEAPWSKPRPVQLWTVDGTGRGRASCIRQSPDGSVLAFLFAQGTGADFEGRCIFIAKADEHLRAGPLPNWGLVEEELQLPVRLGGGEPPLRFDFAGRADRLVYLSQRLGRVGLFRVKLKKYGCRELGAGEGTVTAYRPLVAGDWRRLLISRSSWTDSYVWEVVDKWNQEVVRIPSWNWYAFDVQHERITVKQFHSASERLLDAFVMYSERYVNGGAQRKHPWIVALHGIRVGSWTDSWKQQFNPIAWAQRGYFVVLPNVSGSTGYGSDFHRGASQACGQRPVHDLIEVIDELVNSSYIDPRKGILYAAAHAADLAYYLGMHEIINHFCGVILRDPIFPRPAWAASPVRERLPWDFDSRIEDPAEEFARYPKSDPKLLSQPPLALLTIGQHHSQEPSTEWALLKCRSLRPQPQHSPRPLIEGLEAADWSERDLEWYRLAFQWADELTNRSLLDGRCHPEVTGGSGGIGMAIAKYFNSDGKTVLLAGCTESNLAASAKEVGAAGY